MNDIFFAAICHHERDWISVFHEWKNLFWLSEMEFIFQDFEFKFLRRLFS